MASNVLLRVRRRGREAVGRGRPAVQHPVVRERARPQRRAPAGAHDERHGSGDQQPAARGRGAPAVGHARRRGRAGVRDRAARHHPGTVLGHVRPVVRAARHRVRRVLGRARQAVPARGRRRVQPQRGRSGRRQGVRPWRGIVATGKTNAAP